LSEKPEPTLAPPALKSALYFRVTFAPNFKEFCAMRETSLTTQVGVTNECEAMGAYFFRLAEPPALFCPARSWPQCIWDRTAGLPAGRTQEPSPKVSPA